MHSLQFKKKLAAENGRETNFLSNEETEKWIEDYVGRDTAGARKQVEDAEAAVEQVQEDMKNAENMGLMNREPKKTFQQMMVANWHSLSGHASSDDGENGEDEDDGQSERGKLSEDDKPGWVIHTISAKIQQRIERFWQKQIKLDELPQPEWENTADYYHEGDEKYSTSELMVLAVIEPQMEDDTATRLPTTSGELMQCLHIVTGISEMLLGASLPGSIHIRLGLVKPQLNMGITGLEPAAEPDLSPLLKAKPVEPISC